MAELRGMNERIKKLRQQSETTVPHIFMERADLMTDAYKKYEGEVSIPELRALSMKEIFSRKTITIEDGELIVGDKGAGPQSTPTFPELCCHTLEDMKVMNDRDLVCFKVSDEDLKLQEDKIIPYWEKRSIRHKIINSMSEEWQKCYGAGIFTEFMEQRGPGHTVGSEKIYQKGFLDYQNDIKEALAKIDYLNDPEAIEKRDELKGMSIMCDAIMVLGERYAKLAREMAEKETDETRKAELLQIAANCDVVPAHKPQTYWQAIQMYWFVHLGVTTELNPWDAYSPKAELLQIAANCDVVPAHKPQTYWQAIQMYWFVHLGVTTELNPWDAYSPGRLDQHLYPFYQKDVEDGILDKTKAKELLECLWVKFNNQPAPPKVGITLKESSTYTDFANINTGGITPDGEDGVNDVSYLILDCMDEMKLLQPSSNVQISRKTPMKFIKRACEISRKGWGQPAFYNTEAIIQELLNAGKSIEDARRGGTSGCVETGAFGREAYILQGYFNLPKILEITLFNGYDNETQQQLGLQLGYAEDFKSYDELFDAFKKQVEYFADIKVQGSNVITRIYAKYMPAPFLSIITDDCISSGKDYNAGGARYNTNYLQGVGIGTITDSLSAIKYNVFDEKKFTMHELIEAMKHDFEGEEYAHIYNLVSTKTPKYGNDDDYADDIMKDVFNFYQRTITGRPNMRNGEWRINMLPTTCHVYFGEVMMASPNGRHAHKPVSEGISPEKSADVYGPTAVIKSASKMDHLRTGGTLLNQKFTPSVVAVTLTSL